MQTVLIPGCTKLAVYPSFAKGLEARETWRWGPRPNRVSKHSIVELLCEPSTMIENPRNLCMRLNKCTCFRLATANPLCLSQVVACAIASVPLYRLVHTVEMGCRYVSHGKLSGLGRAWQSFPTGVRRAGSELNRARTRDFPPPPGFYLPLAEVS